MKKFVAMLLVLMMAISMVACAAPAEKAAAPAEEAAAPAKEAAAPSESTEEAYQETIKFVPHLKFATTDTMNTTSGTSLSLYYLVYNNLVEMDTVKNEIVPAVAESWDIVSPTEYVFHIRKGVKFHDGSDLTAYDVEFTFNRAKEQGTASGKVTTIDHVEVIDDYTIKFFLNTVDADILYRLPDGRLSILSKTAFETMAEEEAMKIGCGPYKYAEVVIDDHVSLTRFDEYWGGAAKTKNIIYQEIPEQSARLISLQTGEVDIIHNPAATDLHYIDDEETLNLLSVTGANLRYIGLNTAVAPFDDIRVRQAVAYGINRPEYMAAAYNGHALETNNMMNPSNEFYSELPGYEYNVEKAKSLLAEAGYKEGDITITISGMQNANDTAFATVFQAQMKAIGINVEVGLLEQATFTAMVKRDSGESWQAEVNGWSGFANGPDNALRYLFHTDGTGNAAHISIPELDTLIDEASQTTDKAARMELYKQIEELGLEQACYIPVCVELIDYASSSGVEGIEPPMGTIHHLRNIAIPEK